MWKKIHSNRDPRDTLYSEICKEFGPYFTMVSNVGKRLAASYPKFLFGAMIFLMALSLVLSFTIFRHPDKAKINALKKVNPVEEGFDQIMQATGNVRETLRLKKMVESISAKKQLTGADSALLDSALDRLSKIHQSLQ
ncbi:hypothetical protein [Mucilaginibacter ginsenosidivorax]|uniref:Uncharacterized protein n=1 Tax=Mucilaginibacter ginsenosidivorax TaxID=862126 RepID=A0A5B8VSH6_9SPHI|nr:hypothetical protein [Mucilaginibacter ginsenosidivorax]QEC74604.1 hypothetical protein FSB76_01065 [Mucilaginibacter ginsenosidivorax]